MKLVPRANPVLSCPPQACRALGYSGDSPVGVLTLLAGCMNEFLISNCPNFGSHIYRKGKSSHSQNCKHQTRAPVETTEDVPITQTLTTLVRQKVECTGSFNQVVAKAVSFLVNLGKDDAGAGPSPFRLFLLISASFSLCIWVLFSPTSFFQ